LGHQYVLFHFVCNGKLFLYSPIVHSEQIQQVLAWRCPSYLFFHYYVDIILKPWLHIPITVAARSKSWNFFACSNTGIVGSNATQGMDVCVCVCVYLCCPVQVSVLRGANSRPKCPTDCLRLRYWSETKRFTRPILQVGATWTKVDR
jgi:hypothetical protein